MLAQGARLTAALYAPENYRAAMALARCLDRSEPLSALCRPDGIYRGPIFTRLYAADAEHGRPYVSADDLVRVDIQPTSYLSRRLGPLLDELTLREGMILVTCSGMNLGKALWVREDMDGLVGSHDIIRIEVDESAVPPGYVFTFLASEHGRVAIRQPIYGGSIKHIEPAHLTGIQVPRFDSALEREVHRLVVESARLISEYRKRIDQATEDFFTAVGLEDITTAEWNQSGPDLGFVAEFPNARTFRALNFNPRFRQLRESIKNGPWRSLGDLCSPGTLSRGGRFSRIDAEPEHAYMLIGQRQLFSLQPEGRWIAKSALSEDVFVPPGAVLVAAQGTLGESELYCRAEFAWGSATEFAYSEHILRVIADETKMPRGCLFAFMRSEMAFRMLRSISMGSKLQDHHHTLLPELPVPYPDEQERNEIHEIVVSAYEMRHRANTLHEQAVKLVESAIENAL